MIGQILNYRYEVLEKVGDGTLFSVYKSRDKVLNRLVAVKVLSKNLMENKDFAAGISQSYQSIAALAHPNIARVLEADCTENECFIAAEFVHGTNVKDRIRRAGPMSVSLALDIVIPVLEALEYAHANRVVHGDIRPQDIIVSPDGEVKLTDFGLAPALQKSPAVADMFTMRSIHYQAPEVIEGAVPSASSDIYSLGVVLYEMLTGTLPFDGSTAISVALKKMKELPAPPRSIATAVPKSLSDIVMKAIEKSPNERYSTASALLADLRTIRNGLRTGKPATVMPNTGGVRPSVVESKSVPVSSEDSLRPRLIWLTVLFAVTVLVALGLTMVVMGRQGEVRVPPLMGKTWDEAHFDAQEKNLKLVDEGRVYSDTYEAGKICTMIPPAGSMVSRSNPVVRVKISKGSSRKSIPDLAGLPEGQATDTAVREGFEVGKVTEQYNEKVPVNAVIEQDPPQGVLKPAGTAIDLILSLGPKPDPPGVDPTLPSSSNERKLDVRIDVPSDETGSQDVKIIVNDDSGEAVAYEAMHEPGDKFTVTVTTHGSSARVRVYVGGVMIEDGVH